MTASIPKIKGFEFAISVELYRQGDFIVAYSPDLDLSTYSKSIEGAKVSFQDALEVFMVETLEKGTFFSELEALGWKIRLVPIPEFTKPINRTGKVSPSEVIIRDEIPVSIPIHA